MTTRTMIRSLGIATLAWLAGCSVDHPPPASACAPVNLVASNRFTAEAFDSGLPTSGQWRDGFDLADMNGDGLTDLLHGPPRKGARVPVIFLGDGAGHFHVWQDAHFPPLDYDYGDAKAADFNGDGRMDIALAVHLHGIVTLIGEGGGHYAPWGEGLGLVATAQRSITDAFSSRRIAIADWDRDGRPDLLAANEGPSLNAPEARNSEAMGLWLNRNGYWQRAAVTNAMRGFSDALALGDVDGDGRIDAMIGTGVVGARLLLQINTGDSFASRQLYSLPPNAEVTATALHDFDGDGRADAVDATRAIGDGHYCTALQVVLLPTGARESPIPLWSETSRSPVIDTAIGDIDHDGHDDIVAIREDGSVMMFAGTGGGFTRDMTIATPTEMAGCSAHAARLADLDGDHEFELVVSYAGEGSPTDAPSCISHGGFRSWHLHGR